MTEVPPPNDGYKYYFFGTLIEPFLDDNWIYVRNDTGKRRKMHRKKYPRAAEVLATIQALEGKEVILRTRITGDYDFDPAGVFFSDVYPADELAEGWPRGGDESSLSTIVHLRLTMKAREEAAKRYEERLERYRKRLEAELTEKEKQFNAIERTYAYEVWNSRAERLHNHGVDMSELPDNAWLMTMEEMAEYIGDEWQDIASVWNDPMDDMVDISDFEGVMPTDEELTVFEYQIKDMSVGQLRERSEVDPEFARMLSARRARRQYPNYDNFLDEVAVMSDDQYWDAYGTGSEFGDTNWHWITFATGDAGWEDEDKYLWVGSNKGIAGIIGLYKFPTRDGNYKRRMRSKLQLLQGLPMRLCVNDSNEFVDVDFGGDGVEEPRPVTHFRHMAFTNELQSRISFGTKHYIESYLQSQAQAYELEQQLDQLSPAEKQQLEDDQAYFATNGRDLIDHTETIVIIGAASSADKKAKHPDKLMAINYGIDTTQLTRIEVTFKKQHKTQKNVFSVELPQWGNREATLCLGLNTNVKGNMGALVLRSCWANGDQGAWKRFLAKAGVKKRAKEYDEPIEWFLEKYQQASAIRDGF